MIYLDNAATTPIHSEAVFAMKPWIDGMFVGNPSSLHSAGRMAKEAISDARHNVAKLIHAESDNEIIFTSGGTESDNLAILGMIPYLKSAGRNAVILSRIEHHAIFNLCDKLEDFDTDVYLLPVNSDGLVNTDKLWEILSKYPIGLVSIMLANNETGVVQRMGVISSMCHRCGAVLHTDAVQAVGHMPVDVQTLGIDLLSISGHKFGAPNGVGALYVKQLLLENFSPMILGGGQEAGIRSGTENVAGIVGLGAASKWAAKCLPALISKYERLRTNFISALEEGGVAFRINSNIVPHLPNILSLTFDGVEAEAILHLMDKDGVCLSAASACSAGSLRPSHVLTAMGFSLEEAHSTIRVSFGERNSIDEAKEAGGTLVENVKRLRSLYE